MPPPPPGPPPAAIPPKAPIPAERLTAAREAARGDVAFASWLLADLGRTPGNLCVSPLSLRAAGALAAIGARGATADELRRGFALSGDDAHLAAGFAALREVLAAKAVPSPPRSDSPWDLANAHADVATVELAAALWPHAGATLEPAFVDLATRTLGATIAPLDFAGDLGAARVAIDRWAKERTRGRIDHIGTAAIDRRTALVLASTLYVRAQWMDPFSPAKPGEFTTASGRLIEVPTMARTYWQRYAESDAYQAVALPTAGGASMTIVLPRYGHALDEVRDAALTVVPSTRSELDLTFPRFHLDTDRDLTGALRALGVTALFDPQRAELRATDPRGPLFATALGHRVSLSIDEQGLELAAATSLIAPPASPPPPPIEMHVDHPFWFVIRDDESLALLAVGRVDDPSAP